MKRETKTSPKARLMRLVREGSITTQEKADIVTTLEALCVARERFGAMAMKTFMDDCDVVLKGKS